MVSGLHYFGSEVSYGIMVGRGEHVEDDVAHLLTARKGQGTNYTFQRHTSSDLFPPSRPVSW
jgi:hypothetical protein